jgi:hypothetical protein
MLWLSNFIHFCPPEGARRARTVNAIWDGLAASPENDAARYRL